MSTRDGVATPRMRKQLRLLAVLAGFVVLIVAVAFVAAFRNTSMNDKPNSFVRIDAHALEEGRYAYVRSTADVLVGGERQHEVDLIVVRTGGEVHALWARSPHLGCRVEPIRKLQTKSAPGVAFGDPCGGSLFAIDGRCLDGP